MSPNTIIIIFHNRIVCGICYNPDNILNRLIYLYISSSQIHTFTAVTYTVPPSPCPSETLYLCCVRFSLALLCQSLLLPFSTCLFPLLTTIGPFISFPSLPPTFLFYCRARSLQLSSFLTSISIPVPPAPPLRVDIMKKSKSVVDQLEVSFTGRKEERW